MRDTHVMQETKSINHLPSHTRSAVLGHRIVFVSPSSQIAIWHVLHDDVEVPISILVVFVLGDVRLSRIRVHPLLRMLEAYMTYFLHDFQLIIEFGVYDTISKSFSLLELLDSIYFTIALFGYHCDRGKSSLANVADDIKSLPSVPSQAKA